MADNQQRRISVTTANDGMASFYLEGASRHGFFHTIAELPLECGVPDCNDTEARHYETVTFYINAAREEGSRVFILGFGPDTIPLAWIKAAVLIIQATDVEIVLIPHCKSEGYPMVTGSILSINAGGISGYETFRCINVKDFWARVATNAQLLNQELATLRHTTPAGR